MNKVKHITALWLMLVLFFAGSGTVFAEATMDEAISGLLGTKYKYGGTSAQGFDCSGFTQYVFAELGVQLSRSSRSQAVEGSKINKSDLREGDLVFFNTNGKGISHVGIYIGDGEFAHSSSKVGVTISEIDDKYYNKRYVTARRVLTEEQYSQFTAE